MSRRVSFFANVRATKPTDELAVGDFLDRIKGGTWRELVADVREELRVHGKKAADAAKCSTLPAVTFAGRFTQRDRAGLLEHTGLLVLDFDGLGGLRDDAKRKLISDPHVAAVFVSPSGQGLKALVVVNASDADSHTQTFAAAEAHFAKLGLKADPSGKDLPRLCFVTHDPESWRSAPGASVIVLITEHGVWRRANRSIAEAALSVCHAGVDPKDGALAYVVVGDSEAHFTDDCRIVHGAAALVCGPIPVAWLASLLGPGGVPVVRPTGGAS